MYEGRLSCEHKDRDLRITRTRKCKRSKRTWNITCQSKALLKISTYISSQRMNILDKQTVPFFDDDEAQEVVKTIKSN